MIRAWLIILIIISSISAEEELIVNQFANHNSIKTIFVVTSDSDNELLVNSWEKKLLEVGYNVVSRNKILVLLDEHQLAMAGISNSIKIGEIVGADAVLFVDAKVNNSDPNSFAQRTDIKLISISTGEILMIAEYFDIGIPKDVLESGVIWFNNVFIKYKSRVEELEKKSLNND